MASRARLRDVIPNIFLGDWPPGPKNSLTDVPGVLASTQEIRETSNPSNPNNINTGVTVILPRAEWISKGCYAGLFRFNGAGEMTGSHWIAETGLLSSPIVITNTLAVGTASTALYQYAIARHGDPEWGLSHFLVPVVAETYDGYLNDLTHFAVTSEHIAQGIGSASSDAVKEGNTGGGTGMICQGFKGGTGSSSRVVAGFEADGTTGKSYVVGALVQANYGRLKHLRISGVPFGRIMAQEKADDEAAKAYDVAKDKKDGSIIVILATDAPLHPLQLQRLAKRATAGLARVGGYGHNNSGDIFLAFSTGNEVPIQKVAPTERALDPNKPCPVQVEVTDDGSIDGLFEAAADATEEAIYNALCMAEDMTGHLGRKIEALPLGRLREVMAKYEWS